MGITKWLKTWALESNRSGFKLDSITYPLCDFGWMITSLHLNFINYKIGKKKYTSYKTVVMTESVKHLAWSLAHNASQIMTTMMMMTILLCEGKERNEDLKVCQLTLLKIVYASQTNLYTRNVYNHLLVHLLIRQGFIKHLLCAR